MTKNVVLQRAHNLPYKHEATANLDKNPPVYFDHKYYYDLSVFSVSEKLYNAGLRGYYIDWFKEEYIKEMKKKYREIKESVSKIKEENVCFCCSCYYGFHHLEVVKEILTELFPEVTVTIRY